MLCRGLHGCESSQPLSVMSVDCVEYGVSLSCSSSCHVYPVCCEADMVYACGVIQLVKFTLLEGNLDNLSAKTISFPGLYMMM